MARRVAANRQRLWSACTRPAEIARWQSDAASGQVEPGGQLELAWPGLGASVLLDVEEAVEPERLSVRNGEAVVSFRIDDERISVSQAGVADGDEREGVHSSWTMTLAVLDHYLARHPGRDREVHWLVRRARTSAETAHLYFTNEAALATWLTRRGALEPRGGAYELELEGGARMTGNVLASVPGRDVVVSWEEDDAATLTLRTLPAPSPGERLVLLAWSRWGGARPDPAHFLRFETALDRLARALGASGSA